MPRRLRQLSLALLLAALAGCAGSGGEPMNPSLLRMQYLERAPRLPHLRVDGVQMQTSARLGRGSRVAWRHRTGGDELHRALPHFDAGEQIHETLLGLFESFGFAAHGWPHHAEVSLDLKVEKLLLVTGGEEEGSRACELELSLTARELPSGLEIARFRSSGRAELPGSWTRLRGGEPRWIPVPGEPDPLDRAAAELALRFLEESWDFWRQPENWEPTVILPGRS